MSESLEMNFGMVGLGKMGANIVRRLARHDISSVVLDLNPNLVAELVAGGSVGAIDYRDLVNKLSSPRIIWVMVPAGVTGSTIKSIAEHLSPGDIVIDGGNSFYRHDLIVAEHLSRNGIKFVDVGTSGGVYGLERGYSLMIGGEEAVVQSLDPIFKALAPGIEIAARTKGRVGQPSSSELGYLHCGPVGAGHFVKMIHNGIEYGMMAALAEGLAIFDASESGTPSYDLDVAEIAEVWRRGSVVASWLLDLTAAALHQDPALTEYSTNVSDSGEGRWTVNAAIELGVPAPVLATSLFSRFASRENGDFSNRVLSAMRYQFGGHNESPQKDS